MKLEEVMKLKRFLISILLFLILMNISSIVYANSAAPIIGEDGSGLVFEQNDKVKINKEELYIDVYSQAYAKVKAVYEMENISDEKIENLSTLFLSYNRHGRGDSQAKVMVNEEEIAYQYRYYNSFYSSYLQINQEYLDWEQIITDSTTTKIESDETYYLYRIKSNLINFFRVYEFNAPIILLEQNGTVSFGYHSIEVQGAPHSKECLSFNLKNASLGVAFLATSDDLVLLDSWQNEIDYSIEEVGDITQYYIEQVQVDKSLLGALFSYINYMLNGGYSGKTNKFIFGYVTSKEQFLDSVMAIEYFLNFDPKEKLTVVVEYLYQMSLDRGGYFSRSSIVFEYLLSPAKYWNEFKDLTIYVTLSSDYAVLKSASLEFEREGNTLIYHSETLPETELVIVMEHSAAKMACSL